MIIQALAFYLFATIAVASAVMVISARNPVHSVLFLILTFFNAAGLFVLMGAEFLAMILVVVYVGAVGVLFLFVVMMLDINFSELRKGFLQYLPIGGLVGLILLVELLVVAGGWAFAPKVAKKAMAPMPSPEILPNTHALGELIYTHYVYLFQAAGLILLIAMIGAIVLTYRRRPGVRRQNISEQLRRRPEDTIEIRDIKPGQGV
ncbi:MAG: NADH-quinone oxidoreductase subunit J [Rhodospirillales bacterium]